jgi:hypothetical protein
MQSKAGPLVLSVATYKIRHAIVDDTTTNNNLRRREASTRNRPSQWLHTKYDTSKAMIPPQRATCANERETGSLDTRVADTTPKKTPLQLRPHIHTHSKPRNPACPNPNSQSQLISIPLKRHPQIAVLRAMNPHTIPASLSTATEYTRFQIIPKNRRVQTTAGIASSSIHSSPSSPAAKRNAATTNQKPEPFRA